MSSNPYRELFQVMNEAGIRYLVVGGVAVNLHGYRRFTGDLDILLALDVENLEKMTRLMHSMGYVERLPVDLKSLSDSNQVGRWIAEKGMTAYTFLSAKRERIDVDILAGKSLSFPELDGRKATLDLDDGLFVPVVSMNPKETRTGIDREYLRRSKEMSPGTRLDWLAAAWEFVRMLESTKKKARNDKSSPS